LIDIYNKEFIMPTPIDRSRSFAWNPGQTAYTGTEIVGNLSIGFPNSGFQSTGFVWWNGPDESQGYIIAKPNSSGNQPNPIGGSAFIGFSRSDERTDASFIEMAEVLLGDIFSNPKQAVDSLYANGYWTSYASPILSLDAVNYNESGDWYDDVGGRPFNLYGGFTWAPQVTPGIEGYFRFDSGRGGSYAQFNGGLGSMPQFSISIWHRWDGQNSGAESSLIEDLSEFGIQNYRIGIKTSTQLYGSYYNGSPQDTDKLPTLAGRRWYHIVLTCDLNQNLSIYLDSTLKSIVKTSGSQPTSSSAGISLMRSSGDDYWGGDLGKIEIYNRILKPFQIDELFQKDTARFPNPYIDLEI